MGVNGLWTGAQVRLPIAGDMRHGAGDDYEIELIALPGELLAIGCPPDGMLLDADQARELSRELLRMIKVMESDG